jgi:hypothetical protein
VLVAGGKLEDPAVDPLYPLVEDEGDLVFHDERDRAAWKKLTDGERETEMGMRRARRARIRNAAERLAKASDRPRWVPAERENDLARVGLVCVIGSEDIKDVGDAAMGVLEVEEHLARGGHAVLMVSGTMRGFVLGGCGGADVFSLFERKLPLWLGGADMLGAFKTMLGPGRDRLVVVEDVSGRSVNSAVLSLLRRGDIDRVRVRFLDHGVPRGPSLPTGDVIAAELADAWAAVAVTAGKKLLIDPDTCDSGEWLGSIWGSAGEWAKGYLGCVGSTTGNGDAWGAKFVCERRGARIVYGSATAVSARARAEHLGGFSHPDETFGDMASAVGAGARAGAVMHVIGCEDWAVGEWFPQGVAVARWPIVCVDDYVIEISDEDSPLVARCGVMLADGGCAHCLVPSEIGEMWDGAKGGRRAAPVSFPPSGRLMLLRHAVRDLPGGLINEATRGSDFSSEARQLYAWACSVFARSRRSAWPYFSGVAAYVSNGRSAADRASRAAAVKDALRIIAGRRASERVVVVRGAGVDRDVAVRKQVPSST